MITPEQVIAALKAADALPRGTWAEAGKAGAAHLNRSAQILKFIETLRHERKPTRATQRRIARAMRKDPDRGVMDLIREDSPAGKTASATWATLSDMQHGDTRPKRRTELPELMDALKHERVTMSEFIGSDALDLLLAYPPTLRTDMLLAKAVKVSSTAKIRRDRGSALHLPPAVRLALEYAELLGLARTADSISTSWRRLRMIKGK